MEPNANGRLDGLHGPCEEMLRACVQVGDLSCALTVRDKLRDRGLHLDSSSLSRFFQVSGEEDEVESASPHVRLQRRRTNSLRPFYASHSEKGSEKLNAGNPYIGKRLPPLKEDASKWQDLPSELLMRIIEGVEERTIVIASGVCRDWRKAICQAKMDLSFSWCGRGVTQLVTSFIRHFKNLQVLCLRRCPLLSDEAMEAVATNCHSLRALDLSMAVQITDRSMQALALGCPDLAILDLSGCLRIGEAGVEAMAAACSSLKRLNLCGCEKASTDRVMQVLARSCCFLQSLNLGWCKRITDEGITALARGCRAIEIVDLCGCLLITDKSVVALADNCPNLTALGLHCCRLITDLSMHALVAMSRRLRLEGKEGSTRNHVTSGVEDSVDVESKSYQSGALSSLRQLRKHFSLAMLDKASILSPRLVSLNLSGCICLHAPAVQSVCDAFPALHTCPEKSSLNVSGCLALTSVRCRCVRNDPHPNLIVSRIRSVITPSNRPL